MIPAKRVVSIAVALVPLLGRAESLYHAESYRPLTEDHKALAVGDVITVQIVESATAASSADSTTQRSNGLSATLGTSAIRGGRPLTGAMAVGSEFDGGGTTRRANRLLATVSVTVREVLPNGDLFVSGDQLLTVNEEQHHVRVEGRVRPRDVSGDNVVPSTRLAEARIQYDGEGELSSRARRAWWRRILDAVGF